MGLNHASGVQDLKQVAVGVLQVQHDVVAAQRGKSSWSAAPQCIVLKPVKLVLANPVGAPLADLFDLAAVAFQATRKFHFPLAPLLKA